MKKGVSFGSVFGDSWNIFFAKFGLLALLGVLFSFLPSVVFEICNRDRASYLIEGVTPLFGDILKELVSLSPWIFGLWIFSTFFTVSIIYVLNAGTKKKAVDFNAALKGGWSFYGKGLLLGFLLLVFLVPLYLLLIIPGIIFQVYWMFVFYILVAEKRSVIGSMKRSYNIIKGKWWKVFGYMILFYIIVGMVGSVAGEIFGILGPIGFFFHAIIATLISIFSLIFVNTFYLKLKKA